MTNTIHVFLSFKTYIVLTGLTILYLIDTQRTQIDLVTVFNLLTLLLYIGMVEMFYVIVMLFKELMDLNKERKKKNE